VCEDCFPLQNPMGSHRKRGQSICRQFSSNFS
jgi:hypothetical protein